MTVELFLPFIPSLTCIICGTILEYAKLKYKVDYSSGVRYAAIGALLFLPTYTSSKQ